MSKTKPLSVFKKILISFFEFIRQKIKLVFVLAAVLIIGFFVYQRFLVKKDLETIRTSKQSLTEVFSSTGQIEAHTKADLKFNLPSKLVWLGVKKGDQVNKWQAVASLDKQQLQKNLEKSLLDYMNARWDFEKTMEVDYKDIVLTEAIRIAKEKSQFNLDYSVKDVEIQDIVLKESVLISPIAGTIVDIGNLVAGENLTASDLSQKTIRVVDLSSIYFKAQLDEVDLGKVKIGQKVEIILDSYPDLILKGHVAFIGKEGEKTTGGVLSIPVDVAIDPFQADLIIGLNGEASFTVSQKQNVIAIPRKFLSFKENKRVVYVLEKGRKKPVEREVKTGIKTADYFEIIEGINEDETIAFVEDEKN